jgi:hypothetical protein
MAIEQHIAHMTHMLFDMALGHAPYASNEGPSSKSSHKSDITTALLMLSSACVLCLCDAVTTKEE